MFKVEDNRNGCLYKLTHVLELIESGTLTEVEKMSSESA